MPYVYAPASDEERVADLIAGWPAIGGRAIVFTSSPQVDRLYEVARERGLEPLQGRDWSGPASRPSARWWPRTCGNRGPRWTSARNRAS